MSIKEKIARVRELDEKATKRPWLASSGSLNIRSSLNKLVAQVFCIDNWKYDSELIAEYRTLCVEMTDEVERLEKRQNNIDGALKYAIETYPEAKHAITWLHGAIGNLAEITAEDIKYWQEKIKETAQ